MDTNSAGNSREELTLSQITFSKGRSSLEKCLIGVSIVLFIIAIIFMILFIVYYVENKDKDAERKEEEEKKKNVCNTLDCLGTAAAIADSLDTTVDPCDDFYHFACGKWIKNNPTPASQLYWDNFLAVKQKLTLAMRELLEAEDKKAPEAIQKVRAFYKSCINTAPVKVMTPSAAGAQETETVSVAGTAPWLKLIGSRGANVFPTLDGDSWVDEEWTFSEILARLPRKPDLKQPIPLYDHPLVHFSVGVDGFNSDKYTIFFSQTSDYHLIRYQFLGDRNSPALQNRVLMYMIFLLSLGANSTVAALDAKDVLDFEIRVAQATLPIPIHAQKYYKKMTMRQLSQRYPQFDWLGYVQGEFSSVGINVTMDEEVAVDALDYFDKIFDVINSTSQRTLLNYCWFSIIQGYILIAPKSTDKEIKNTCATHTHAFFPDAVSRLYVDKHFSETTRKKVEDLIVDLESSFRDILQGTEWMSEQTKKIALEKLDTILDKVGYSDDVKNDTYLNEKTEGVFIDDTDVLASIVNVSERTFQTSLRRLRQRHNRQRWLTTSATVNAYYNPQTNSIVFPAAFLQTPIYKDTVVDALIYGGVGFFIGHELTHGFDNQGGDYDKDGNVHNWWKPEDLKEFERRGECMVEQYSKFAFPEMNLTVNGRNSLGENIADNGGMKEAYLAYKKMVARRGKEDPQLPVLGYTPDQLFFIGSAQFWCINVKRETQQLLLQDVHAPHQFRAIGPMQNSLDFAKAFNCPVGSYMNPEKKCHVW